MRKEYILPLGSYSKLARIILSLDGLDADERVGLSVALLSAVAFFSFVFEHDNLFAAPVFDNLACDNSAVQER